MRKTYIGFFTVFVSLVTGLVITGAAQAQIVGTQHDLGGGICEYCHTPVIAKLAESPLWNRRATTEASFKMYDSPTMASASGGQPHGISLVCLACHDGVISRNTLLKNSEIADGKNLVVNYSDYDRHNLASRHPISVSYDRSLGPDFNGATAREVGGLPLYPIKVADVVTNNVECASCHNPHDMTYGRYLRMDNTQSALCLTCHVK